MARKNRLPSPQERKLITEKSLVCDAAIVRYFAGAPVRAATAARIERAVTELSSAKMVEQ